MKKLIPDLDILPNAIKQRVIFENKNDGHYSFELGITKKDNKKRQNNSFQRF